MSSDYQSIPQSEFSRLVIQTLLNESTLKIDLLISTLDFSDKHVHVKFADASNKNKKMYKPGLDVSDRCWILNTMDRTSYFFVLFEGHERRPSALSHGATCLLSGSSSYLSSMVSNAISFDSVSASFLSATTSTANDCFRSTSTSASSRSSSYVLSSTSTSTATRRF